MQERGSTLFFTLIMISLISLLTITMLSIVAKQRIVSANYQRELENHYLLTAAVAKVKSELKTDLRQAVTNNYRAVDLAAISKNGQVVIKNLLAKKAIIVKYKLDKIVDEHSKLNINVASKARLRQLSIIGVKLSDKIYQRRCKQKFKAIEEVQTIKGIASSSYTDLEKLLTTKTNGKININTASSEILESFSRIGSGTADNIIVYRKVHGSFTKLEDLKKVSGIGEVTYQNLKSKVKTNSNLFNIGIKLSIPKRNLKSKREELVTVRGS